MEEGEWTTTEIQHGSSTVNLESSCSRPISSDVPCVLGGGVAVVAKASADGGAASEQSADKYLKSGG